MSYVLVCSNEASNRRLYVDNLVLRGYLTVGTSSAAEAQNLVQRSTPRLIVLCSVTPYDLQAEAQEEVELRCLRSIRSLDQVPIILISPTCPDARWIDRWGIARHLPYPLDCRRLVNLLSPWINPVSAPEPTAVPDGRIGAGLQHANPAWST
jgi:CheY-like chemotaxis protein